MSAIVGCEFTNVLGSFKLGVYLKMQLFSLALGMLVVVAVALVCVTATTPTGEEEPQIGLAKLAAPKLFDFANYKKMFNKHYATLSEELTRRKYFLARAFRAFIAGIKFKFHQLSYYLSVNHMSDYSPAEFDKMRNRVLEEEIQTSSRRRENNNDVIFEQSPDSLEAIRKLAEERANEPVFQELKRVFEKARRKRSVDELELRELPVDRLINSGVQMIGEDRSEKVLSSVGGVRKSKLSDQVELTRWYVMDSEDVRDIKRSAARKVMGAEEKDEVWVDLRRTNCFLTPRKQGLCGSCYAFAIVSIMEWTFCMKTGKRYGFSEQYLLDCGPGNVAGMKGCEGADMFNTGDFVHNFGLEMEHLYPYKTRHDECPYDGDTDLRTTGYIRGELNVGFHVPEEVLGERVQHGPLYLAITVGPGWFEYGGGVHGDGCSKEKYTHAVVLVGHGRENGREYWLIRNSYGHTWGEGGYYKLAKAANCIPDGHGYLYTANGKVTDFLKLELNKFHDGDIIKRHNRRYRY